MPCPSWQAGGPHEFQEVWKYFFTRAGELMGENLLARRQVKAVLGMLRSGIRPHLVPATADCQYVSKQHEARFARFVREMEQLMPGVPLGPYLEGPTLLPVQFPNSSKLSTHPGAREFLKELAEKYEASG